MLLEFMNEEPKGKAAGKRFDKVVETLAELSTMKTG